ncbi:HAD-IA family hydrolase [Methylobacterium sp. J-030]|uniref:HAD-IA family hydrolase n=1 Tax=Methylobacterium sp. J-030 TaxID=2836627 RepID=UPI001FBAF0FF|nr:HAD-IA family hydrolase [Methylobacterium sp. J-030]MCJ2067637.1 HAD-IA family hydrolase [Methylobacterium sp. J-030]
MQTLDLADFDAVTFDVYGTLIDWEPAIIAFLNAWADRHGLAVEGDALLMAFDRARAAIQKERPAHLYPDVLRRCFDRICAEHGVEPDPQTREAFADSPKTWPAYPDSHEGLLALQARAKVGALSNIDEASLLASSDKLGFAFDLVVTAERVGAYKPDWPHFHTAIDELAALGIPKERILHVGQSLRADVVPANKLGITSAWVHRPGRELGLTGDGVEGAKPDLTVASLAELVAALTGASPRTAA